MITWQGNLLKRNLHFLYVVDSCKFSQQDRRSLVSWVGSCTGCLGTVEKQMYMISENIRTAYFVHTCSWLFHCSFVNVASSCCPLQLPYIYIYLYLYIHLFIVNIDIRQPLPASGGARQRKLQVVWFGVIQRPVLRYFVGVVTYLVPLIVFRRRRSIVLVFLRSFYGVVCCCFEAVRKERFLLSLRHQ